MQNKIIDLSVHNGNVDFKLIKASGIYGVILRAGFGRIESQKDKKFEEYYTLAKEAGLHIGAYWFSYAQTAAEAKIEADVCINSISEKTFDLPIFYDIEDAEQVPLGKEICTDMVNTFCSALEKAGYWAGVYSFDSFFNTNLSKGIGSRYTAWVARVDGRPVQYCPEAAFHQYSWKHKIGKMSNMDISIQLNSIDYPTKIKSLALNGYKKELPKKYAITARIANLDYKQQIDYADKLKSLGMTVVSEEQD